MTAPRAGAWSAVLWWVLLTRLCRKLLEMCWDLCIDADLNASRSAGMELYLLSFGTHGGVEAGELDDEDYKRASMPLHK